MAVAPSLSCFNTRSSWRRHIAKAALGLFVLMQSAYAPTAMATQTDPALVQTDAGSLRGLANDTERAFLAIPYALPPVGQARWRPPQPAPAWRGERPATRTALPCAQPRSNFSYAIEASTEDCLYLNVHTPPDANADSALPVLVWIHGGANVIGSASEYPAATLARTGRTVVVTLNYRLGVFGYLALPGLQQEDPRLNYGIQDQQLALRWVQRHIARFGGDPQRVTVAGQSAGGGNVLIHLISPLSQGLFQQAIIQSAAASGGALGRNLPATEGFLGGQSFAKAAGCPEGLEQTACLRAKSTAEVLTAAPYDESFAHPVGLWGPVVDGVLFPDQIFPRLKAGTFQRVPILTGITRHEFRLLVALAFEAANGGVSPTEEDRRTALTFLTGGGTVGDFLNAFYPTRAYGTPGNALGSLLGDFLVICPTHNQTKVLSRHVPTYAYRFDDPAAPSVLKDAGLKMGAYHAGELQYIFDQPTSSRLDNAQKALALQMKKYWSNFVTTGDPTLTTGKVRDKTVPDWPRFNAITMPYRDLRPGGPSGVLLPGALPTQHKCLLWNGVHSIIPAPVPITP